MSDKRVGERIEINHEFRSVDAFLREYALNVSQGGVFIRTTELWPVGTVVQLNFTVIVEDFETIEGEGRVVRVVKSGEGRVMTDGGMEEGPGVGVVFTSLSPQSQQVLGRLFTHRV